MVRVGFAERGEAFVDTPNTVLRRVLGLPESGESTGHPVGRLHGRGREERASRKLAKLVADDRLSADEELVWERRNNGERHTAKVSADGTLLLEDGHVADGTPLADLWGDARRREGRREGRRHGRRTPDTEA